MALDRACPASAIGEGSPPLERFLRDPHGVVVALVQWLLHHVASRSPLAIPALVLLLSTVLAARRWWRLRCRRAMADGARVIQILPAPIADPAGALALWSHLTGLLRPAWRRLLLGQPHLAWEYVLNRDSTKIQLWVPGSVPPGMVERAVEAAWPGARTRTTPATEPVQTASRIESASGELRLARNESLPLRTDFNSDPLRALLGAPFGLAPSEQVVVQVLARPVTGRRLSKARRSAHRAHAQDSTRMVSRLLDIVTPGMPSARRTPPLPSHRQTTLETSAQDRAIVAKQHGGAYEGRIRYAITDLSSEEHRTDVRARLRGRAHAVASVYACYSDHNYFRRKQPRKALRALAERRLDKGDLWSIVELSVLAHLPWDVAVPGLQRAGARAVSPPPGIAPPGPQAKPIGLSDAAGRRPVALWTADARQHIHLLGATGSGKSHLLAHMILADAEAGRGQVVVDPKGDLVMDVLARLPEHLGDKVVLLDADSRWHPPILNPLDGADTARTVDNLVSIFSRVYAAYWGPRTDDILRAGLLTLRALPGTPLLTDLLKLLSHDGFRKSAMVQTEDDVLRGFWSWYDELSSAARAQITAPLMNKLRGFLLRPFVRQTLAGGPSTVDMDHLLDSGGLCLVRVTRGALGPETAHLIGSVVVARTWQAATRRASVPQDQRRDASLYIDEAHHFLNLPYPLEDMLAEARGYRLSLTLAHQYLRQLPRELEEGISTNARTKIFFNSSPEDARILARHTEPRLTAHDLSNLDAFHVAVRPVLHGTEAPAFTAVTMPLPPPVPGRARRIRAAARRNARPAAGRTSGPNIEARPSDPRRARPSPGGELS
ncbi:type IV secretory system conjugative DNA transfer family protein [Streptomyces sp. NPDC001663]|uniref:type IV secretory system conjugative DNA transfer family protein n=1 Tax=Streptomyces sp. NPDC001663 TaxID=3364597 RepID=UPI00369EEB00